MRIMFRACGMALALTSATSIFAAMNQAEPDLNEVARIAGLLGGLVLGGILMPPAIAQLPTARLDAVVARLIAEHRASGDSGDILSMLVLAQEDGVGMSDEQVRDEVMLPPLSRLPS